MTLEERMVRLQGIIWDLTIRNEAISNKYRDIDQNMHMLYEGRRSAFTQVWQWMEDELRGEGSLYSEALRVSDGR